MTAFFDQVDAFGRYIDMPQVERPRKYNSRAATLTRDWPDCTICGCGVNDCACDPDDVVAALLAKLNDAPVSPAFHSFGLGSARAMLGGER